MRSRIGRSASRSLPRGQRSDGTSCTNEEEGVVESPEYEHRVLHGGSEFLKKEANTFLTSNYPFPQPVITDYSEDSTTSVLIAKYIPSIVPVKSSRPHAAYQLWKISWHVNLRVQMGVQRIDYGTSRDAFVSADTSSDISNRLSMRDTTQLKSRDRCTLHSELSLEIGSELKRNLPSKSLRVHTKGMVYVQSSGQGKCWRFDTFNTY
ncbi:hypothetical protein C8R45DRAFT_940920 [Mycena sanguinolenta]|nr:hypothetical protein C8R45DRAFT_940920 [Mycena sanguinolenta]